MHGQSKLHSTLYMVCSSHAGLVSFSTGDTPGSTERDKRVIGNQRHCAQWGRHCWGNKGEKPLPSEQQGSEGYHSPAQVGKEGNSFHPLWERMDGGLVEESRAGPEFHSIWKVGTFPEDLVSLQSLGALWPPLPGAHPLGLLATWFLCSTLLEAVETVQDYL